MTAALGIDWPEEMSIAERRPPEFFRSRGQIDATGRVPQAHVLRRAFDGLALDGILCRSNAPFLYFKEVPRIEPQEVWKLYRRFWNQGLAPVLILITPGDVHIYSGLAKAPDVAEDVAGGRRLVTTLNRVKDAAMIRQLVLSLESGEFFRRYPASFDPDRRVDRELLKNLEATRAQLDKVSEPRLTARVLDALLCRVVFTCYLFDRKVIIPPYLESFGITGVSSLRDIVGRENKAEAKTVLYDLFEKLRPHFNGDLFSDDLAEERGKINDRHLEILALFISGADVTTGQGSFWPYDFSVIPIETISAIYEHFLKADDPEEKKETGAFYTPRFLAEFVLDLALEGFGTLLDKRFFDPACGSGIFLVGLFNRLAEEWSREHPGAPYDEQANALMRILRENLYGVDRKPTACRIAAFSLYLAMLDQLKPSDIQELQRKGKVLPPLVYDPDEPASTRDGKSIIRADFFTDEAAVPPDAFHLVVGNPPWASVSGPKVPAEIWCERHELPLANRQLAQAFVWKAPFHVKPKGRVCFVLPHGIIFNHQVKAIDFQISWIKRHTIDLILNLADFKRFLFQAEGTAVVARYYKEPPVSTKKSIAYLAPKTDWSVSKAAIISVVPEDRSEILLRDVLASLQDDLRPFVWKERFWGTPRDWKFLDRLSALPRLREIVSQVREPKPKRWLVAQGFQPMGKGDDPEDAKEILLPTKLFVSAKTTNLQLFLLESDCKELPLERITVRRKMSTTIFRAPHVLVSQGMKVAYAGFDVSFQHAVQGIHGPDEDKELLAFLTAYLRSPLARYFLFHTTAIWGVYRSKVHLAQLLTVPFPLPEQTGKPERSRAIVAEIAANVRSATAEALELLKSDGDSSHRDMLGRPKRDELKTLRAGIVQAAQAKNDELIYEYFDVDEVERVLVEDTTAIVIPSTQPSQASERIPTLKTSSPTKRREYADLLCDTLNDWANGGPYRVQGQIETSPSSGVGVIVLERYLAGNLPLGRQDEHMTDLIPLLKHLQSVFTRELGSVEMPRGLKVFDRDTIYLIKPLTQRFWTRTAALNDADDIAATILMQPGRETP
jgi:hypothetical protein